MVELHVYQNKYVDTMHNPCTCKSSTENHCVLPLVEQTNAL